MKHWSLSNRTNPRNHYLCRGAYGRGNAPYAPFFVPLTEDKRLCAKEILGNRKKDDPMAGQVLGTHGQEVSGIERGESASETGRDHIPPRVFKQMTRLTKQMEKLDAMLSDVKFTNYKERTAQIAAFLEKYIPDVAAMETQMKKYQRCFYHS